MATVLGKLFSKGPAFQYLEEALKAGKEYSRALEEINELGLSILPEVAETVNEYTIKVTIPKLQDLKSLAEHLLPNISSIPHALTKTLRNFSYQVKVTGTSTYSSQLQDQYITVSTNSLLTKEQAADAAIGLIGGGSRYDGLIGSVAEVQEIKQNPGGLISLENIIPTNVIGFGSGYESYQDALKANRAYVRQIASGPAIPIFFTSEGKVIVSGRAVKPS